MSLPRNFREEFSRSSTPAGDASTSSPPMPPKPPVPRPQSIDSQRANQYSNGSPTASQSAIPSRMRTDSSPRSSMTSRPGSTRSTRSAATPSRSSLSSQKTASYTPRLVEMDIPSFNATEMGISTEEKLRRVFCFVRALSTGIKAEELRSGSIRTVGASQQAQLDATFAELELSGGGLDTDAALDALLGSLRTLTQRQWAVVERFKCPAADEAGSLLRPKSSGGGSGGSGSSTGGGGGGGSGPKTVDMFNAAEMELGWDPRLRRLSMRDIAAGVTVATFVDRTTFALCGKRFVAGRPVELQQEEEAHLARQLFETLDGQLQEIVKVPGSTVVQFVRNFVAGVRAHQAEFTEAQRAEISGLVSDAAKIRKDNSRFWKKAVGASLPSSGFKI